MSTTIDQRVVEMRFDNRNFETNVSNTMSTIDKLKQSLRFKGATEGFESISSAANKVNMSGLGSAVDTIKAKFSALEVIGVTALANITNSAVNAGKKIVSALTIDPIKTGFSEYETKMGSVQTILANTESKGTKLPDVTAALDDLNTYADKTIYNFQEMTRNIGTFTAAGVDLDKSVTSIKGIANLAAVSGSTSAQASTAMYQLSQALAAGKVSLMDWNSVVNAGMGGEVFQTALKRTAEHMGTDVDAMIEKYGSFRESLTQGEWLTAEVLTETLTQLSGAYSEADLIAQGYTEEQAKEIAKLAKTAESAATEVKTFSQLWDTLKESAQSGWAQTWELIVGDFEEAKALFTGISDTIGGMLNKSAEARNKLVKGWKEAGGRTDLIEGFKNAFDGIMNIVNPIREAFRDIFPPTTVDQLVNVTKGFKNLTASFAEFTAAHGDQIKSTFKGIFSVLDIGWTVVKELAGGIVKLIGNFTGLGGGILDATASFGDWLSNLRDSIKETDILGTAVDKVVGFLSNAIKKIKEFGSSIKDSFSATSFEGFASFFEGLWDIIQKIGSEVGKVFSSIGDALSQAFGGSYLDSVINTGMLTGIAMMIKNFMGTLKEALGEGSVLDNIKGILDDVRGSFEAYQNNLQADTLTKIATAIAILAGAIFLISTIDAGKLAKSLGAITVLFGELMGSLAIFEKLSGPSIKGVVKTIPLMIGMGTAILILSSALKVLSTIDMDKIAGSLVAMGVLMAELSIFLNTAKFDGRIIGAATGIAILSGAMIILAQAVKSFGAMEWGEIGKGLASIGALLAELAIFTNLTGNAKHVISTGIAMGLLASAMKVMASAVKDFAGMEWSELGRGLAGMAGALAAVTLAMRLMPTNTLIVGAGLVVAAAGLKVMADALSDFSNFSWDEIARGLAVMGGALLELSIALNLMKGTLGGSAALVVAAGALAILAPVMETLGGLSWTEIAKGLVSIAGAFAVLGIAGAVLGPLVPSILGLAGSFAMLGLSVLGIGAGLALAGAGLAAIATGLTALAAAGTAGATAIVASLTIIITGIVDLIPTIISKVGEAILALCKVVAECAPQIADSLLTLVTEVINSAVTYIPQIVDGLLDLLIQVLQSLAQRIPELVTVAVEVIAAFFQGVIDALSGFSFESLVKTIAGIGLIAGLMAALGAIVHLIPGAMAGVLGMGVVIAELALVLAAVGALAQIPGLSWLIGEGGDLLQQIGTAIGQFVGGIVGGIAEGATSTLPQIGTNLSDFMSNIQPFISGAQSLDASMLEGVKTLAESILILTAADLLNSVTSWITGGDSLTQFASQLVPFGQSMREYANEVAGIDPATVTNSATAAKALAEVANNLPNSGGLAGLLAGENDMSDFAKQLVPFGKSMKKYSEAVMGIDPNAITNSATAAKALAELANNLPNSGGLISLITGDNDISDFAKELVPLGKAVKSYSDKVVGIDIGAITNSISAVKKIVKLLDSMGEVNTSAVSQFKAALSQLATVSLNGFINTFSNATPKMTNIGSTLMNAVVNGMKSKSGSLTNVGSTAMNSLVNGMKSKTSAVTNLANTTMSNMLKAISSKQSAFQNAGTQLMARFVDGINTGKNKIGTAFTTAMNSAVTKVRGYHSKFYNAGSYMVDGLKGGITDNAYKAVNAAAKMAADAYQAAMDAVGAASPAKRFIELGMYSDQGLAKGLLDYAYLANDASSDLGGGVLKAMQDRLKIKSPSVVFNEEVGRYIVDGVAEGIAANTSAEEAASQKAQNIVAAFQAEVTKWDARATTDELEYKLWEALNPNATASTKSAMQASYLAQKMNTQNQKLALARDEYQVTLETLGENAEQTRTAYNKYLQEQINMAELDTQYQQVQKDATKARNEAYVKYYESLVENAEVFEQMKKWGYTDDQLNQWAMDKAGYDPNASAATIQPIAKASLGTVQTAYSTAANDTLGNLTTTFSGFGESYTKAVGTGVTSSTSSATSAIKKLSDTCLETMKAQVPSWEECGSYMVQGFERGVRKSTGSTEGGTSPIIEAVKGLASKAISTVKSVLKINSPSKVFYELGSYTGAGFVNAIRDFTGQVYNATSEMGQSAKDGFSDVNSQIQSIFNMDIGPQPTIRPILDLSDIQNGASQIDGLFAGHTLALAGANAGYSERNQNQLADVMDRMQKLNENANANVVNAISNLRGDFGSLVTAISNLHIALDGDTVVGQLVGRIDSSLGQIASYKGRGN